VIKYNFVPLNALQEISKDSVCGELFFSGAILFLNSSSDVIGIVKEVSALSEITSKLNRQVSTFDTLKLLLLFY
jgi:replication factor A1